MKCVDLQIRPSIYTKSPLLNLHVRTEHVRYSDHTIQMNTKDAPTTGKQVRCYKYSKPKTLHSRVQNIEHVTQLHLHSIHMKCLGVNPTNKLQILRK